MSIVILAVGVVSLGAGIFVIVTGKMVTGNFDLSSGDTKVKAGESGLLLAVGLVLILLVVTGVGGSDTKTKAKPSEPIPVGPGSSAPSKPGLSPTPTPTQSPTATPTPSPSPTKTALSSTGPWQATNEGLTMVVEDAQVSKELAGRLVLTVHLVNNHNTGPGEKGGIFIPAGQAMAVDDVSRSYQVDVANSTLPFDATPSSPYFSPLPFAAGTSRGRGTVTLDRPLDAGVTSLTITFTAGERGDYSDLWRYFHVSVPIGLPA